MESSLGRIEADIIASLLPRYEAEGFDVYVQPSRSILPPFMQAYQPDAIALKENKKIAIEIIGSTSDSAPKVKSLKSLFEGHDDWELQIFYASPVTSSRFLPIASANEIDDSLQEVNNLISDGHFLPALVMAWATFEAIARSLLPEQFQRPQTPARLVEVLGSDGYITPDEADILRSAMTTRNAVVHGQLDISADKQLVEQIMSIIAPLADLLPDKAMGPSI